MANISAIILTFNEEKHLKRCLESVSLICKEIIVVDSYSNDRTENIAKEYNAKFYQNPFKNYSEQLNWAINNTDIRCEWVLRIDADEYLTNSLIESIEISLPKAHININGFSMNRLMFFLGKPIKKGGMYPISHLRIWRKGFAHCEERWMDERMVLKAGQSIKLDGDLVDDNLNDITWWINKHNKYATREAIDVLNYKYSFHQNKSFLDTKNGKTRRKLKSLYINLPLFIRPIIFFFFRYFFQLGFLEGIRGFIWSLLQCLWYRTLVDVKIFEVYLKAGTNKNDIIKYFKRNFNYDVTSPSK